MHKPNTSAPPALLIALLAVLISVELILQAADHGLIGSLRWRSFAYEYGAFWPGILGNWRPNFFGQQVTMFFTYAVLHSGLGHLAGNAILLWIFGRSVNERVGQRDLMLILMLTSLAGAFVFAGLSTGIRPMVGASGAVFGLAGVLTRWQLTPDHKLLGSLKLLGLCIGFVLSNLLVLWWQNGQLAWQTHLGSFLAGLLIGCWKR